MKCRSIYSKLPSTTQFSVPELFCPVLPALIEKFFLALSYGFLENVHMLKGLSHEKDYKNFNPNG